MRLLRLWMGAAFVLIAFAVFALTSRPHDDLAGLKPYITSERDAYYTKHSLTGHDSKVLERTIFVHDLELDGAHQLETPTPGRSHGNSFRFSNIDDLSDPVRMSHAKLSQIVHWEELKWNEVLWVRLTHLGRDPFRLVSR